MAGKDKTLAMLALGKPDMAEDEEAPVEEGGEGVEQAMSDFLDAVKAEDPVGMAAAFQDAVEMSS